VGYLSSYDLENLGECLGLRVLVRDTGLFEAVGELEGVRSADSGLGDYRGAGA
jgi:hypothetical protein